MQIEANGAPITTVQNWFDAAPPKGGIDHWVAGRSARELAEAWCGSSGPCVPPEIQQLLQSHPDLVNVVLDRVFPEHRIRFDTLRGEPRNADLAIAALDRSGIVAITIEGKADESFDRPVATILQSAATRIAVDERTGAIARIQDLAAALLPPWRQGLAHLGDLRYQLLTGIAGTLAWAREIGASRAVFAVHEFATDRTRDENHARNAADLDAFLNRLSNGSLAQVSDGMLVGPIRVPGNSHIPTAIPLYIGKASSQRRSAPSSAGAFEGSGRI